LVKSGLCEELFVPTWYVGFASNSELGLDNLVTVEIFPSCPMNCDVKRGIMDSV